MKAVEFVKVIGRLCKAQEDCRYCPLQGTACDASSNTIMECDDLESVQKTVKICEQWAKDHPVKTRQSEFLKMFPNAKFPNAKTDGGVIIFCPRGFLPKGEAEAYCEKHDECIECCKDYWLTEVTDNEN